MGLKKLIGKLQKQLGGGGKCHKRVSPDGSDALLVDLEKKERKLERKLATQKNVAKRKRLKCKLKFAQVQRNKGIARRRGLGKQGK